FRRGLPHVGLIVGYLLLLWLLVAALLRLRDTLVVSARRAHRLALTATEYVVQTLYHGVLLFLLPAYWAATTLTSVNVFFFLALVALALLATFDPWYQAVVHPYPLVGYVFFLVSLFGALNLALPLVGLPPVAALGIAAWVAVVALTPALCRARAWPWSRGLGVTRLIGRLEGQIINVIRLTPVEGGRREGYRTFSRKTGFPADPKGRWTVDVTTASGQLIGRMRFRVAP